jgi:hypothetical protein
MIRSLCRLAFLGLVAIVIPLLGSGVSQATAPTDLVVTSIRSLAHPVCAGTVPTFRATIRNNSEESSGPFNIRWIADGLVFDGGHLSIPARSFDTHDHIWQDVGQQPAPISPGQHTLTFIADTSDLVGETTDRNNARTVTFMAVEGGACP